MQRNGVTGFEERLLAWRCRVAVGARLVAAARPRPDQNIHAEGAAVAGDHTADTAIAVDAERLAAQRRADADLPSARLQRCHLLRNLAHRGKHQSPGEFRGGVGGRARMLARAENDAVARARLDIDMRVDAAL